MENVKGEGITMNARRCLVIAAAVVLLAAVPLPADTIGASAHVDASLRLMVSGSGSWSDVGDFAGEMEMFYGVEPSDSVFHSVGPGVDRVYISDSVSNGDLEALSSGALIAECGEWPDEMPDVNMSITQTVSDVWHFAQVMGYTQGVVGIIIPDHDQSLTIRADYKYSLTLANAQPGDPLMPNFYLEHPEVDLRLNISFSHVGQELLTAKSSWVPGNGLEMHFHSETVGYSEISSSYPSWSTTTWPVSLQEGEIYVLWARAEARAQTPYIPEPASLSLLALGGLAALRRRHR